MSARTIVSSDIVVKSFKVAGISNTTGGTGDVCVHECAAEPSLSSGNSDNVENETGTRCMMSMWEEINAL